MKRFLTYSQSLSTVDSHTYSLSTICYGRMVMLPNKQVAFVHIDQILLGLLITYVNLYVADSTQSSFPSSLYTSIDTPYEHNNLYPMNLLYGGGYKVIAFMAKSSSNDRNSVYVYDLSGSTSTQVYTNFFVGLDLNPGYSAITADSRVTSAGAFYIALVHKYQE